VDTCRSKGQCLVLCMERHSEKTINNSGDVVPSELRLGCTLTPLFCLNDDDDMMLRQRKTPARLHRRHFFLASVRRALSLSRTLFNQ